MKKNIINKLTCGLLIGSLSVSMLACGKKGNNDSNEKQTGAPSALSADEQNVPSEMISNISEGTEEELRKAAADFSIKMFQTTLSNDGDSSKNMMISPLSIQSALGMAANGAAGNTLIEMQDVLAGGAPIADYNAYMQNLKNGDDVLSLANSIWIRDDSDRIQVNDGFLALNKLVYNAEAFMAPFDNSTVKDVNNWVNEKTHEMIPEVIKDISGDAVMMLVNAAAFEGKWEETYSDDSILEHMEFYNANGETEDVTMLSSTEGTFLHDDNATGFLKYYEGDKYAFMAMLPNEGVSLDDYVQSLDGESFINLYDNRSYCDVYTLIPEFTSEYERILNADLSEMGINEAFSDRADFSNMATTKSEYLYISKVIHKTFISLDRNGTRAAAVTVVVMEDACSIIEEETHTVYLDRPFMYAIIDTDTGLPVFIGITNTVN